MSFDINWNLLDDKIADSLKEFLNNHLKDLETPEFLGPIRVSTFEFGSEPPSVIIKDITEPLTEFYLSDNEVEHREIGNNSNDKGWEDQEKPENFNSYSSKGGYYPIQQNFSVNNGSGSPIELSRTNSASNFFSQQILSREDSFEDIQKNNSFRGEEIIEKKDEDVQIEILIEYYGNMKLTITTELHINQPTPSFMVLPVTLSLTGFSFSAIAILAYLRKRINFCFKESDTGESLLKDINIDSEVGDTSRQVLKNVGKIERFIVEQIRKLIDEFLTFPSYHSIDLNL
ncbi:Mitochondrial distribution and morphology protein 12 [Clydaea vesicula]|uniref:Mitochondrial distribution and morphology protein 12 n=1 Tax=Clydaea vesicula TaxID=447962 RepID=A0AAD5U0W3_9FUNG|nr:Mitochondrial distribution and morphology protein 12 [Clydaea vesicula]